jgi:hypothetical protein
MGSIIPRQVKSMAKKLVFAASALNKQQFGIRAKTGWLEIRIMC